MKLRILYYFLTVAREEGINRAAEALHVTQPTLSRQLLQLEEDLGVKLFHRGSRKISLTNEGILLKRRAEEILTLVNKTEKDLLEQERLVEGRITIGGGELAAMQVLSNIIASFHQKYPHISYDIFTANADLVKEQIEKGLIDIGILLEPINIEKFNFIRLPKKERWIVLMPPDDPLMEKDSITAKDLKDKSLILPRRQILQSELSSWFGRYFKNIKVLFTSNLSTNGALMVQQGLGYSLVIEGSVPLWDKEKIGYRPLSPELATSSVIAWKKQEPLTLPVSKFIEYAECFLGISNM